jgi:hypothetical protein
VTLQWFIAAGGGQTPSRLAPAFAHTFAVCAALSAPALLAALALVRSPNHEQPRREP